MLEIRVDSAEVQTYLQGLRDRGPEALALGINRTVEEGLAEVRTRMRRAFTIREHRLLPPHKLPRAWQATPRRLWAPMQLGDDEGLGLRRRQVYGKFEEGGPQTAKDPAGAPFAAPTEHIRPSPEAVIPRSKYPRNLVGRFDQEGGFKGLARTANTKVRLKKLKGGEIGVYRKQVGRYFVLGRPGDRFYGVYERTGPGRSDVRLLWHLFTHRRIPVLLGWEAAAKTIAESRFHVNLRGAWEALAKLEG